MTAGRALSADSAADAGGGRRSRASPVLILVFLENWAAPLALGGALSLTQAPASLWMAAPLALSLAAWLLARAEGARAAARLGWLLGVGYFLPGLLWMGEAFLVEAERFAWMRPFAVTLLPMGLGLFWAAAFAAAARVDGGPVCRALTLAAAMTAAETLRSTVLTGFPWGLFVYGLVETPIAQAAAWVGPFALNGWTIFAALAPFFLLQRVRGDGAGLALGALGVVSALGLWVAGEHRLAGAETRPAGPIVRLVQPNVPQIEKWRPEHMERNFRSLIALSGSPSEGREPDLVIWPEVATPYPVAEDEELRRGVMSRLPAGARLAFGALRREGPWGEDRRVFNSLHLVGPAPEAPILALYDKHHLVPFGEYVPLESVLEPLGILAIAGGRGGFASGPGPRVLTVPGLPPFQPLICYEAIFAQEIGGGARRPEWLLHATNDAWFGDSSGPWQHFVQARFRAIEQGAPLYRAANTGVSAGVDPYGRVIAQLGVGKRGVLDLPLLRPVALPTYQRVKEGPLAAILSVFFFGIVALRAR